MWYSLGFRVQGLGLLFKLFYRLYICFFILFQVLWSNFSYTYCFPKIFCANIYCMPCWQTCFCILSTAYANLKIKTAGHCQHLSQHASAWGISKAVQEHHLQSDHRYACGNRLAPPHGFQPQSLGHSQSHRIEDDGKRDTRHLPKQFCHIAAWSTPKRNALFIFWKACRHHKTNKITKKKHIPKEQVAHHAKWVLR